MRVSTNGRYLTDLNGEPFFYLADTAWMLFYHPSLDEIEEYFDKRKEQGYTVVMPCLVGQRTGPI